MRSGKHQYVRDKLEVLDATTVREFVPRYMEHNKIEPNLIAQLPYSKWKDYLKFSTLDTWKDIFSSPDIQDRQILIVGDYDVDGIMSSKIALWLCHQCGVEIVDVYIPNRFVDGYGLNKKIVDRALEDGFDTILTVDNGISAFEAIDYAIESGIEVLLTDHHHVKSTLPNATQILHPDLGSVNDSMNICGTAVIFALAYSLFEQESKQLLPYVMLATLADSMDLLLLNRSFVLAGIDEISNLEDPFLKALIKQLDIDVTDASSFAWKLIPVLNAVGRMGDVNDFAEVLFWSSHDVEETIEQCVAINQLRKQETEKIVNDVRLMSLDLPLVCAYGESWHQGVLGIAASRIMEEQQKPVILFSKNENIYKGSGRSPDGFDLFAFLQKNASDIYAFGGHANACGLTLVDGQYEKMLGNITSLPKYEPQPKQLIYDIHQLSLKEIEVLYKELTKLAPFGNRMPQPIFHQTVKEKTIRYLGSERQHVKCTLPNQLNLLFFNEQDGWRITEQAELQVVGNLSINRWQDAITFQMIVDDWWIDDIEIFYPNQVPTKVSNQLFVIEQIPMSQDTFTALKKETQKYGLAVLKWQDAQKGIVNVDEEKLRIIYKYFLKQERIEVNNTLYEVFRRNGIEKNVVNFAIKVFLELEFVIIKNGVIEIQRYATKRKLSDSHEYQKMLFQYRFIQEVVYAPYKKIKELFIHLEDEQ